MIKDTVRCEIKSRKDISLVITSCQIPVDQQPFADPNERNDSTDKSCFASICCTILKTVFSMIAMILVTLALIVAVLFATNVVEMKDGRFKFEFDFNKLSKVMVQCGTENATFCYKKCIE